MNSDNVFFGLFVLASLVSLYKFMQRVNDSNYGTRNSFFESDADYDFSLTHICLTLGAIAMFVWLALGGLGTPVGGPVAGASRLYGSGSSYGYHRPLVSTVARMFVGRSRGFR